MLATWLSFNDLTSLVKRIYEIDRLGYAIIYGVSNNKEKWWDNHLAGYIGWQANDSSQQFENDEEFKSEINQFDKPEVIFQGGGFAAAGHFED